VLECVKIPSRGTGNNIYLVRGSLLGLRWTTSRLLHHQGDKGSNHVATSARARRALGSEQSVAYPQRPVPGRAELGEFAVDVSLNGTEEVDVLAVCWGDVGQQDRALVVFLFVRGQGMAGSGGRGMAARR
jgi:hypothetical protein